jgi:hypothetical protein
MRSYARAQRISASRRVSIIDDRQGPRQFVFGAAADAAGAAAEAAAAGDDPGDGDGVASLGSGAPDCVNTIDVTFRSGVACC